MFGLTSDEEVGATHAAWQARIHPEDLPVVLAKVRAYQENPSERLECEYRVRHRSGVWIWVLDRGRWLGDTGRQLMVGTLLDISSRKEMEQRLLRMAITDPLTGLSNRRAFNERLQLEWARLKRSPEIQAALVLCDIDHFKRINDTYGHGCGDEVLKHFASRLREHVRATDMAARIGGEEFAVLLEAASIEDAQVWAERFRQDTAATAVVCGEVSISYSASMGGSPCPPFALCRAGDAAGGQRALPGKKTRVQPSCGCTSISELRGVAMKEKQADPIKTFRAQWAVMTFYERFEQVIALALSAIIAVIIVVSLLQLISIVFSLLIIDAFNPLDHKVFQTVFGMIMTLLIAMEFKHSIVRVALRRDSIIQVKTVILIGLIALARKFVILDPETGPAKVAALAGATLALGATYWLLRERDDRTAGESSDDQS